MWSVGRAPPRGGRCCPRGFAGWGEMAHFKPAAPHAFGGAGSSGVSEPLRRRSRHGRSTGQPRGGSGVMRTPRPTPAQGGRGCPLPVPAGAPESNGLPPAGAAAARPLFSGYSSHRKRPKICHLRGAASRGADGGRGCEEGRGSGAGSGATLCPPGGKRQGPGRAGLSA